MFPVLLPVVALVAGCICFGARILLMRPGFTVYSVGPDEDDEGGHPESPNETGNHTGDITFTWYDPPQKESR